MMTILLQWMLPALLLISAEWAEAGGFRCGTRLVLTGDPISRLARVCGQPDTTFRAHKTVREGGTQRRLAVTQWVYERRGRKAVIVSVRDGRVLSIEKGG